MIVSIFGNAKYGYKEEDEKKFLELLEEKIGDKPCDIYLGGYGLFDRCAMEWCLKYKEKHANVKTFLIIPYINRGYNKRFFDGSIYPPLEKVPKRLAIVARNVWMVDKADIIIAYMRYIGYTRKTLDIARRKKKPIYNIAGDFE